MSRAGQSWGRLPQAPQQLLRLHDRLAPLPSSQGKSLLAYGNGRSYGDVCANDGGLLLDARGLDRWIRFDAASGVLRCEAGVLLAEIISLVLPKGWFLPVTPGTQFVTVGGAIANDVHGKNHHRAGSFGRHVLGFELLRSDGSVSHCTPTQNPQLFAASIGGLGLTGLIRWAELQLKPCEGPAVVGESLKFSNLDEFFARMAESDRDWEYSVAWVDCAARGAQLGRGLLQRGRHARREEDHQLPAPAAARRLPLTPPFSLLNRATVAAFNAAYYGRQRQQVQRRLWHWQRFFYPLDGLHDWNRLYGPRGFYQYQCLLPMAAARAGLAEMLTAIASSGQGSCLAVLKLFGALASPGLMSFPREGATLALDFPNRGAETLQLLERLDAITRAAGGAVYPAKDARMTPASFNAYFPRWREFSSYVDPAFSSSFWRRVTAGLG